MYLSRFGWRCTTLSLNSPSSIGWSGGTAYKLLTNLHGGDITHLVGLLFTSGGASEMVEVGSVGSLVDAIVVGNPRGSGTGRL